MSSVAADYRASKESAEHQQLALGITSLLGTTGDLRRFHNCSLPAVNEVIHLQDAIITSSLNITWITCKNLCIGPA